MTYLIIKSIEWFVIKPIEMSMKMFAQGMTLVVRGTGQMFGIR